MLPSLALLAVVLLSCALPFRPLTALVSPTVVQVHRLLKSCYLSSCSCCNLCLSLLSSLLSSLRCCSRLLYVYVCMYSTHALLGWGQAASPPPWGAWQPSTSSGSKTTSSKVRGEGVGGPSQPSTGFNYLNTGEGGGGDRDLKCVLNAAVCSPCCDCDLLQLGNIVGPDSIEICGIGEQILRMFHARAWLF